MNKNNLIDILHNPTKIVNGYYDLYETQPNATLNHVHIVNIPKDAIAIKMEGMDTSGLLCQNEKKKIGYAKHSEVAIITDDHVVLIEMKSRNKVNDSLKNECLKKFRSDLCMLSYADAVIKELMDKNKFFDNINMRYVLLYQSVPMHKTPTGNNAVLPPLNDKPNRFRRISVINASTLDFNSLL